MRFLLSSAACAAAIFSVIAGAHAETPTNKDVDALLKALSEQADRLNTQEKAIEESRKSLDEQQKNLLLERVRFNQLKSEVMSVTGKTIPDTLPAVALKSEKPSTAKSPTGGATATTNVSADAKSAAPKEVGVDRKEAADKPPEISALADVGGVLTPKGRFVVTPAVEYSRSSAVRVDIQGFSILPAINIGSFEITDTDRDMITGSVSGRYGITNRFEVNAKVPYVYRSDATKTRPINNPGIAATLSEVTGSGIGDVEVGASYQINNGQEGWPFLISNLRYKTATGSNPYEVTLNAAGVQTDLPTGSGFNAIQPSITAIYPSDPVVFYSNVGYLYNFPESFKGIGEVDPGDSVNASFGMSFSLNERASFSLGYGHNTVFTPSINGVEVPGSTLIQAGTLDLGYAYSLTDRTSLNFGVSVGVTDDAPDARLTLRLPMAFGK